MLGRFRHPRRRVLVAILAVLLAAGGVVFVASTDTDLLRCFEAWLQMRATVNPAPGIVPLAVRKRTAAG